MNRGELREAILNGAADLGIQMPRGMQAMALLSLELLSDGQVEAIGGVIDEGIDMLRRRQYGELHRLILSIGGTEELAQRLIDYARAADQHPDQ